jgi:hypothetical protein
MSDWTHSICRNCWESQQPGRIPVRTTEALVESCCFCGHVTQSGIYVRANDQELSLCRGHAEAELVSNTHSSAPVSSPPEAGEPSEEFRRFHVAGWGEDSAEYDEAVQVRCWICGVTREFGGSLSAVKSVPDGTVGLDELAAWARAHACPGLAVT